MAKKKKKKLKGISKKDFKRFLKAHKQDTELLAQIELAKRFFENDNPFEQMFPVREVEDNSPAARLARFMNTSFAALATRMIYPKEVTDVQTHFDRIGLSTDGTMIEGVGTGKVLDEAYTPSEFCFFITHNIDPNRSEDTAEFVANFTPLDSDEDFTIREF